MLKRILCYGDSNTWGQVPLPIETFEKRRYPKELRWTGLLQSFAPDRFEIIEEGLNGRTTGPEDSVREGRNGLIYLQPCLDSHVPLDGVIFMLGTNDLKRNFSPSAASISERMRILVRKAKAILKETKGDGKILVVAPVLPKRKYVYEAFQYENLETVASELTKLYEKLALEESVFFLNGTQYLSASKTDGAHLEAESHLLFAKAILKKLETMF